MDDEFQLVTNRKKSRRNRKIPIVVNVIDRNRLESSDKILCNTENVEKYRRILGEAKSEVFASGFFKSFKASLKESLSHLKQQVIQELICFGLGNVCECLASRYQFALILCLKDFYNIEVRIFDPIFTKLDKEVLKSFDCIILDHNCEGKFTVADDYLTLFYLPHCPKQLTNNILWANWGINLSHCICIANSFTSIIESSSHRTLAQEALYILTISPYILEYPVINNHKYFEIFNDTAIHIFPTDKISSIPSEFWKSAKEPHYSSDMMELIKSS